MRIIVAKTKCRPLHDRVVVKRIEAEEKSKGGIIIPDTAKEKPQQGEVVVVGPRRRDENGKLVPIDRVRFTYPGASRAAVGGLPVNIEPGQLAALVGPTGAGKTTITHLVAR